MILTLEVMGPEASALGAARRKVLGVEGGSLGRLPDNDWVLADPSLQSEGIEFNAPALVAVHPLESDD